MDLKKMSLCPHLVVEKKEIQANHFGLFATQDLNPGSLVFLASDWWEDTREGWSVLSPQEIDLLPPSEREIFLKYSFDIGFGKIQGTFSENYVKNLTNFLNHSCSPNLKFDPEDNLVTTRLVFQGEELTVDYGTFVVNVDQSFLCGCGSSECRKQITKGDWRLLLNHPQKSFPSFLREDLFSEGLVSGFSLKKNAGEKTEVPMLSV